MTRPIWWYAVAIVGTVFAADVLFVLLFNASFSYLPQDTHSRQGIVLLRAFCALVCFGGLAAYNDLRGK